MTWQLSSVSFFLMNRGARSILLHKVKFQIFSRYRVTSYFVYSLIWLCLYAVKKKHFNVKMTVTVELSLRQFVFGWILCIFSILFCDLILFITIKHKKKVIFHGITDLFLHLITDLWVKINQTWWLRRVKTKVCITVLYLFSCYVYNNIKVFRLIVIHNRSSSYRVGCETYLVSDFMMLQRCLMTRIDHCQRP